MKKLYISSGLILAFSLYILFLVPGAPAAEIVSNTIQVPAPKSIKTLANATAATPAPTVAAAPPPKPVAKPAPKPAGMYKDGTYVGSVADASYGMVQVQAFVTGGKIADVKFLQYPNDQGTSRMVNGQAMPYLIQEAIQAQTANVNIVSGATDTSMAFQQSLGTALAQAKA